MLSLNIKLLQLTASGLLYYIALLINTSLVHYLENYVFFMGEERKLYKVLVGKPEGKIPLGKPRCRCDQNGS
jgi:hypothetical protein